MVQNFPFSGFLNYDDPDEVMPVIHNRDCRNVVWKGTVPNLRAENIPGTRERVNPFLINDGGNLTIGRYYDPIGKRIFTFNYRGDNNKAIYMYDTMLATWYRLIEQTINAENGILGFTQIPIVNIDIIYGDSLQGDILYWVDSLGRPSKVNINRALSGGYGTIRRSYLDVAKEPANIPPSVVYENDPSNTINNLRKKLFKFKIRWVFDDNDKAVTSTQSEVPIPFSAFNQAIDPDPTRNCRIAITYQTGPANVVKIEILAAVSIGNVFSDYFLIQSVDKAASSLLNNDVTTFLFYNNQGYNYIDVEESNQLQDYVPQLSAAQTILNGNVLAYGNITEGYPNLTNFTFGGLTSALSPNQTPYYYGNWFGDLVANQGGESGFGSGTIHISVRGIIDSFSSTSYTVYMTDASTITYTLAPGDDASSIIEGLRVDAISKGYTINIVDGNNLYVTKNNISLARAHITSNYAFNTINNTSFNAYPWLSKYGFGLVYRDDKGKTNGVVYTSGFSVSAASYTENTLPNDKPSFDASIYHIPPDWAYDYQWVRTKDLSKSKMQQWITDRTYKDTTTVSGQIKYAFVSIESLNDFVEKNPGSPLGYDFSAGDRIRFFKRYNPDNTTASIYGTSRDYEIVASLINPTINGEVRSGQFIKFILPPTDGTFDFGATGFANYFIELYTPAQSAANNLNVYYEFGERYAIGNPTTSNRFHQGMLQNQVPNTTTPATFQFTKGDYYIKARFVQAGNVYTWNITNNNGTVGRFLFGMDFVDSTYSDPNITAQSVAWANISGNSPSGGINPGSDSRWFLGAVTNTTFAIRGNLALNFTTSLPGDTWRIFLLNKFNERQYIVEDFDASNSGVYNFPISDIKTLENDNIFLIAEGGERPVTVLSSVITFSIDHVIPQQMIDANFSDYYPSAVNSNGRPLIFDENANRVNYPVMYRWSLAYQADTSVNQSCRFYPQNFDNVDRRFGAIKRMLTWDRLLTFFQERKCGQTGVYQKFISDNTGSQQLVTTNSIITDNNVQYYAGNFGVGNQSDGVIQSGYVYYFPDPIKGVFCRLSRDGITVLSEVYKTQTYAGSRIPAYLTNKNYTFGGQARITGTFNVRKDNTGECLFVLQPWTFGSESFSGETMAFDEGRNAFSGFYDFAPEQIVCAENVLYSFRNGKMYIHDNTTSYNTFYGVFYESTITRVFNAGLTERKNWISLTEVSSVVWNCPEISTNNLSYAGTLQRSNLLETEFENIESNFSACFLGDLNSIGSAGDGESLKGNLIKIKFRATGASSFVTFSAVNLYFIDSPFTNK